MGEMTTSCKRRELVEKAVTDEEKRKHRLS